MSLHDKNRKDIITDNNDNNEYTAFEQFIEWCSANKKAVTIAISVMLVHTLIFVGIIVALRTGNSTDIQEPANPSNPSHQEPQPIPEPVEAPEEESVNMVEDIEIDEDSIEDNSEPSESDTTLSAAYDAGKQTGELLNESIDAVIDFFQGLNEVTGASVWAREQWDSGIERVTRWLDENSHDDDDDR